MCASYFAFSVDSVCKWTDLARAWGRVSSERVTTNRLVYPVFRNGCDSHRLELQIDEIGTIWEARIS
jgi:hypothetical protein